MTVNANPTFMHQLRTQIRVIWALTMREMITRYGREGLGILWFFAEPMMFIVGVMVIFSHIEANAVFPVAEYLAVSYPTLLAWRNGTGKVTKAVDVNRALLHHRPVHPMDLIYSRILLEFSSAAGSFMVVYLCSVAIGVCTWPADMLTMLLGYALVLWFSFGFVLIMAALAELSETVEKISHIILYLMLPFSGVFTPAFLVPDALRPYLLFSPLVNAVEYMHHGYYGVRMHTYYNVPYVVVSCLALTFFGLVLSKIAINRVKLT